MELRRYGVKTLMCCLLFVLGAFSAMAQKEQDVKYEKFTGKIGPYAITLFVNLEYADEDAEVGYYYYNDLLCDWWNMRQLMPKALCIWYSKNTRLKAIILARLTVSVSCAAMDMKEPLRIEKVRSFILN